MSNKVYVDVLAEFSKDGLLIPKEITWEDGRKYEITRVKDKRRAASTRAGGVGERYTCVVDGKEIFLFYLQKITYLGSYCPSSNELTVTSLKGFMI